MKTIRAILWAIGQLPEMVQYRKYCLRAWSDGNAALTMDGWKAGVNPVLHTGTVNFQSNIPVTKPFTDLNRGGTGSLSSYKDHEAPK